MNTYQISTAVVLLLSTAASAQRTPTISYITPDITSKIGGTIEMDCSVLYAAEYPVLWVKLPPQVHILLNLILKLSSTQNISNSFIFRINERSYNVMIAVAINWSSFFPQSCDNQERGDVLTGNFRKAISHKCTPIPLSSNSALILRDNRFR